MRCPNCSEECILKEKQFYWRGRYFTGWVCKKCKALWENEGDSFLSYVRMVEGLVPTKREPSDYFGINFYLFRISIGWLYNDDDGCPRLTIQFTRFPPCDRKYKTWWHPIYFYPRIKHY